MLKWKLTAIIVLCYSVLTAQVLPKQDKAVYQASFEITFQTDSTNPTSLVHEQAILLIGKQLTKFESANKMLRDSLLYNDNTQPNKTITQLQLGKIPKTKFLFEIYQYNHQVIYRDQIMTERFQYTETPDFNWQLGSNDTTIAGYRCQSATCNYGGRNYTAWFTDEIPIPTGPYKFFGLPGFIVAVEDSAHQVQFILTGFKKLADNYIITPSQQNYTQVTKSVFLETLKKYKANPSMAMNNTLAALKINIDESAKNTASEKLKKENNLIEKF
ncbi:GLPGLI family protein [Hydrotalea sp.]|uniref:GLPGLI family protein n=1 Tax=Hydrotalea sp. TaxID=2881279 RepID=UPI003D0CF4C7